MRIILIINVKNQSGTVALSAEKLNRKWIGIEISKEYCDIIKQRVCDYTNDSLEF